MLLHEHPSNGPWEWDAGAPHILNAPFALGSVRKGITDGTPVLMLTKNARRKMNEHNAKLIEAAPLLYAACQHMLLAMEELIQDGGGHYSEDSAKGDAAILHEAITKAGGWLRITIAGA